MTVALIQLPKEYICLTADTKPTSGVVAGSVCWVYDSGTGYATRYIYTGAAWALDASAGGTVSLNAGSALIGYANEQDPAATTGTISAADVATTSATNSNGQTVVSGTPTANSSVSCTLSAHAGVTIQLTGTGTSTGTFAFERSVDGGTKFVPMSAELVSVGSTGTSWVVTDNNPLVLRANAGELTTVRVRCTAKTFTSFAVNFQPGFGVAQVIANQGPPNAAAYAWPVTKAAQNQTLADGSAISWLASGGTYALTCTSITNNNGRQGAKGDLGATRAKRYAVQVTFSVGSAATNGLEVEVYWAASPSATAGTSNPGGLSGTDATFNTTPDEYKLQLQYLGSLVLSNNAGTGIQTQNLGPFTPRYRYGMPVIVNKSGQTFGGTAGDHTVTLTPMQDAG